MAYLTQCCCCMTVKTGTKVLAILSLISSIFGVIALSVVAANFDKLVRRNLDLPPEYRDLLSSYYGLVLAYVIFFAISLVVAALCLHGANTDRHHLLLPYLVYEALQMVVKAILIILLFVVIIYSGFIWLLGTMFSAVISLALQIYFFVVVLSFYKQLSSGINGGAIIMMPVPGNVPQSAYVAPPGYAPAPPVPQYYPDSKMGV